MLRCSTRSSLGLDPVAPADCALLATDGLDDLVKTRSVCHAPRLRSYHAPDQQSTGRTIQPERRIPKAFGELAGRASAVADQTSTARSNARAPSQPATPGYGASNGPEQPQLPSGRTARSALREWQRQLPLRRAESVSPYPPRTILRRSSTRSECSCFVFAALAFGATAILTPISSASG